MSMKRKKVGHEQGLSVQLNVVGHFFPRRPPPKRNCPGTSLITNESRTNVRLSVPVIHCPIQHLFCLFMQSRWISLENLSLPLNAILNKPCKP